MSRDRAAGSPGCGWAARCAAGPRRQRRSSTSWTRAIARTARTPSFTGRRGFLSARAAPGAVALGPTWPEGRGWRRRGWRENAGGHVAVGEGRGGWRAEGFGLSGTETVGAADGGRWDATEETCEGGKPEERKGEPRSGERKGGNAGAAASRVAPGAREQGGGRGPLVGDTVGPAEGAAATRRRGA